jgi:hypothetical protein
MLPGAGEDLRQRELALMDLLMLSERHGYRFKPPPRHPFNSLYALRSTFAEQDPKKHLELALTYFRLCWHLWNATACDHRSRPADDAERAFTASFHVRLLLRPAGATQETHIAPAGLRGLELANVIFGKTLKYWANSLWF